jgi:hypothetical protein
LQPYLQLGEEIVKLQMRKNLRAVPSIRFHQQIPPADDAS